MDKVKPLNKLQIRHLVVSMLLEYQDKKQPKSSKINEDIKKLNEIENKNYLLEILLKELAKSSETTSQIIAVFITNTIPNELLKEKSTLFLEDKNISDSAKLTFITVLKQIGIELNAYEIQEYLNEPYEIAQSNIKGFLSNVEENPEVQIDLMDFYFNISKNEKIFFLNNLIEEFKEEEIIVAFSIIASLASSEEEIEILEDFLLKSKSQYAIEGLEGLIRATNNPKQKAKYKRKIQKIKLSNTKKEENLLIKNSKIDKCYTGLIDGNGIFPLIFSRKDINTNKITLILTTINVNTGINSTIGFVDIDELEVLKILSRLFNSTQCIKINAIALKSLFEHFMELNFKTDTMLPYETFVWKKYLDDVRAINFSMHKFINAKLDVTEITPKKIVNMLSSEIFDSWFYIQGQMKEFDEILEEIENKKLTKINDIENLIKEVVCKSFITNEKYLKNLCDSLLLQSYILHLSNRKIMSATVNSLRFNKTYLVLFIVSIIKKSIWQYFIQRNIDLIENKSENIFKNNKNNVLEEKEIEKIIESIEKEWKLETE